MTAPVEAAAYGRSLAARLRLTPPPGLDWAAYGDAARSAFARNMPPPPMARFAPDQASTAATARSAIESMARPAERYVGPRTCHEVIQLRKLKLISRRDARRMMGMPVRWWRFGR